MRRTRWPRLRRTRWPMAPAVKQCRACGRLHPVVLSDGKLRWGTWCSIGMVATARTSSSDRISVKPSD